MQPKYDLDKIKFATDTPAFEKAIGLYESGKVAQVTYSGRLGELSKGELSAIKKEITGAMKYIKPYNGPSRIWFSRAAAHPDTELYK